MYFGVFVPTLSDFAAIYVEGIFVPTLVAVAASFAGAYIAVHALFGLVIEPLLSGIKTGEEFKHASKTFFKKFISSTNLHEQLQQNEHQLDLKDFKKVNHIGQDLSVNHDKNYYFIYGNYSDDNDPSLTTYDGAFECKVVANKHFETSRNGSGSRKICGKQLAMKYCKGILSTYEMLAKDDKSEFKFFYKFEGFEGTDLENEIKNIEQKLSNIK